MSQALIHAADLNDNNTSAVDAGSQRQPVASQPSEGPNKFQDLC